MSYKYVFIITYGRSGSTLLQGLLNSIDSYYIKGENYNFCYGFFKSYQSLLNTVNEFGNEGSYYVTSPWFGAFEFNADGFIDSIRPIILEQLFPDSKCDNKTLGFKEIRYVPGDEDGVHAKDLLHYLEFMEKIFSNSTFILLTRKHDEVANSAWWKSSDKKRLAEKLKIFEETAFSFGEGRSNFTHIDYADVVSNNANVERLFGFLGQKYNAENVNKVLSIKHSYVPKGIDYKYHFSDLSNPAIFDLVKVDHFRKNGEGLYSFGGIVLLNKDISIDESFLKVFSGDSEIVVQWGIESPYVNEKFGSNSNSLCSRFLCVDMDLSFIKKIDICVISKNIKYIVGSIEFSIKE